MALFYFTFILSLICVCLYGFCCFLFCDIFFPRQEFYYLFIFLGTFTTFSLYVLVVRSNHQNTALILGLFSFWLFFHLAYRIKPIISLLCAFFSVLSLLIFKGIGSFLVILFVYNDSSALAVNQPEYNIIVIIATASPIVFAYLILRKYIPAEKVELLLSNSQQQRALLTLEFSLFIFLLIVDNGRLLLLKSPWFSIVYIASFVLGPLFLILVVRNAVTASYLVESELRVKFLKEQLERQLQHYRSYQKHTETLRAFKHDYKNMVSSIKALNNNKNFNKASLLLNKMENAMTDVLAFNKNYSNNLIIDAILYHSATVCEEYSINFNASVYMSELVEIDDLNLVRVFSNLLDNAIEATSKVPNPSKRFISITGTPQHDRWVVVTMENSYHTPLEFNSKRLLKTTKKDATSHGLGIKIITDIMVKNGGLLEIDTKSTPNVFKITLAFPCSTISKSKSPI